MKARRYNIKNIPQRRKEETPCAAGNKLTSYRKQISACHLTVHRLMNITTKKKNHSFFVFPKMKTAIAEVIR